MDTVLRLQCQLQLLGYSGPLAPPEALLYPGETHYQLLAWLFRSLRGEAADKSGSADEVDTPGLVEAARNLGFSNFEEIESLQVKKAKCIILSIFSSNIGYLDLNCIGAALDHCNDAIRLGSDSYHRKADFLFLVADLLKASKYTDHDGWSVDDQTQKDIELIDLIGQELTCNTTCKLNLFPPDVSQHRRPLMSGLGHPDLGKQIAELKRCEETLKERKDDLVELKSQGPELVSYDNTAAHAEVEAQLQDFLSAVEHCNQSFPQERIASLATAKLPQLHGIGPAAKRVHGSYEMLKQLLLGLDTLRIAKGKLPAPPEDKACAGNMSLERLTVSSNSEIVNLDRDIRTLSTSKHFQGLSG